MRRMIAAAIGIALFMVPQTASAGVGPRIKIHPHVNSATYDKPLHEIRGRVGIVNGTNRTITIRCTVVATLHSKNGTAEIQGSDTIRATVGPHRTRQPHYRMTLRDKHHRFRNSPSRLGAHCLKI